MDSNPLISQTPIPEIWQFPLVGVPPWFKINGRDSSVAESMVAESMVTDYSGGSRDRWRPRDSTPPSEEESSKIVSTSSANDVTDSEAKHLKGMRSTGGNENGESKTKAEASSKLCNKLADQCIQPSEAPKQDYIHVRARRGQATDSHSLSERARRERISERMKILQDLVPGCNKVIGKASVLDEIINYIQALQRQVEFLSMKLEAVNSRVLKPGIEGFPPKDFGAQAYEPPSLAFSSQAPREYAQGSATDWLHMQVGGALERVT